MTTIDTKDMDSWWTQRYKLVGAGVIYRKLYKGKLVDQRCVILKLINFSHAELYLCDGKKPVQIRVSSDRNSAIVLRPNKKRYIVATASEEPIAGTWWFI